MTTEQFTYWLQGFLEINNPKTIDEVQTQIIKDHLDLVFDKKTPDRFTDEFQKTINSIKRPSPPDRILEEGKEPTKPRRGLQIYC